MENKSIWDWDLYHKIRGTNSIITNKLKIRKEILNKTDFKEYIKHIIDDMNKKSIL